MPHPLLFIAAIAAQAPAATAPAKPVTRADLIRDTGANFAEVDTNKDGSWSKAEIEAAQARGEQRATAQLSQRMSQEFTKLDTDKNGQLSLAEFRAMTPTVRTKPGSGANALQRLDTNKDGKVSVEEYRGPLLAGFDRIDANKDGTVTPAERSKATTPTEGR